MNWRSARISPGLKNLAFLPMDYNPRLFPPSLSALVNMEKIYNRYSIFLLYSPLQKTKKGDSNIEALVEHMSCYGVAGDTLTCLISEKSLTFYEMLGNGAFGYVRRGKWAKDSRKKVSSLYM